MIFITITLFRNIIKYLLCDNSIKEYITNITALLPLLYVIRHLFYFMINISLKTINKKN